MPQEPADDSRPEREEVTRVLDEVARGTPEADTHLLRLVYGELKRIAVAKMAGQSSDHTLQPTALVHEAYLRLLGRGAGDADYADRAHFFTAAAAAMRSILVDHARRKAAAKRAALGPRVTLHPELVGDEDPLERVLQVHEALERMAHDHPRTARVVELLFFAGLTAEEAASALGVSDRTVKRDWRFGRAWLARTLGNTPEESRGQATEEG